MDRGGSQRVTTATLRLAGLASVAVLLRTFGSSHSKVLLHRAILQFLGHPGLDMLVKLAAVDTTLLALLFSYNLPSGLQPIRANSSSAERHLGSMDGAEDDIQMGMSKAEAARIDLVKMAEDLKL